MADPNACVSAAASSAASALWVAALLGLLPSTDPETQAPAGPTPPDQRGEVVVADVDVGGEPGSVLSRRKPQGNIHQDSSGKRFI